MSNRLELVESDGARALVAPGFSRVLDELHLLDREAWRATLGDAKPRGRATAVELIGGQQLVLRGFRHGGAFGALLGERLRSPQRLFEEMRVTHALAQRGAPVPSPAFAVAHRSRVGWTGGIATLRVDHATNALDYARARPERLERVARAAGHAIRAFHDAGGRHSDLHIGNLMVRETGETQVIVIDLDRARALAPPSPGRRAREIARLERSLHKHGLWPQAAARTFIEAYVASDAALSERLRTSLRRERLRVAFHRASYALRSSGAR